MIFDKICNFCHFLSDEYEHLVVHVHILIVCHVLNAVPCVHLMNFRDKIFADKWHSHMFLQLDRNADATDDTAASKTASKEDAK